MGDQSGNRERVRATNGFRGNRIGAGPIAERGWFGPLPRWVGRRVRSGAGGRSRKGVVCWLKLGEWLADELEPLGALVDGWVGAFDDRSTVPAPSAGRQGFARSQLLLQPRSAALGLLRTRDLARPYMSASHILCKTRKQPAPVVEQCDG